MNWIAIIGIISSLIVAPTIVLGFVLLTKREKNALELMKYKKEIIELEVEKEKLRIKSLEEENKKYDKLIENKRLIED